MKSVDAIRTAAAVMSMAVLTFAAAGCGGDSGEGERTSQAIASLYAIDHRGDPTDHTLALYTEAFRRIQQGCAITADELGNSILKVASDASNGSGTTISNLEALRAVADSVGTTPVDCSGVFVGVEARLEGGTLDG